MRTKVARIWLQVLHHDGLTTYEAYQIYSHRRRTWKYGPDGGPMKHTWDYDCYWRTDGHLTGCQIGGLLYNMMKRGLLTRLPIGPRGGWKYYVTAKLPRELSRGR